MIRLCTLGLGLFSFGLSFLTGVLSGVPPAVRVRRSLLALLVGLAVGALLGVWLRRLVLAQIAETVEVGDAEDAS